MVIVCTLNRRPQAGPMQTYIGCTIIEMRDPTNVAVEELLLKAYVPPYV